jgi:hypothetical protein
MKVLCAMMLCLLSATLVRAQDQLKPFSPSVLLSAPAKEAEHTFANMVHFRDKTFALAGWLYVGAYAADMITTQQTFNRCPVCVEGGSLANGQRSVGKLSLEWGAVGAANLVIAHAWKTHVHKRFLHALWATGLAYEGTNHVRAAYHNAGFSRSVVITVN